MHTRWKDRCRCRPSPLYMPCTRSLLPVQRSLLRIRCTPLTHRRHCQQYHSDTACTMLRWGWRIGPHHTACMVWPHRSPDRPPQLGTACTIADPSWSCSQGCTGCTAWRDHCPGPLCPPRTPSSLSPTLPSTCQLRMRCTPWPETSPDQPYPAHTDCMPSAPPQPHNQDCMPCTLSLDQSPSRHNLRCSSNTPSTQRPHTSLHCMHCYWCRWARMPSLGSSRGRCSQRGTLRTRSTQAQRKILAGTVRTECWRCSPDQQTLLRTRGMSSDQNRCACHCHRQCIPCSGSNRRRPSP